MQRIIFFLMAVAISFSVSACLQHKSNLVEDIESQFEAGKERVILREMTDFDWDKVCFYIKADSSNFSAYNAFVSDKEANSIELPKKDYGLIIVFYKRGEIAHVSTNGYAALYYNGDLRGWRFDGEAARKITHCSGENTALTLISRPEGSAESFNIEEL